MKLWFTDDELADIKDSFEGRFRTSAEIAARADAILVARRLKRVKNEEARKPEARKVQKQRADHFRERFNKVMTEITDSRHKAASFDQIAEMLDHMQVGRKRLGDCTRADLEREADILGGSAEEIQERISFYRSLAAIVGNKTVREASDRARVIELLVSNFESEA